MGYIDDEETELYYLRSRYYSVHHYRFINADGIITRNIYAYCSNKPVILKDKTGYAPTSNKFSVCMCDDGSSVVGNIGNSSDTPYAKEGDGNYYRHDRDDLYFEHAKLHHNIPKEEVQKWYNSLSRDDYPAAGLALSILPIPSWLSLLSELFSLRDDMSPDATTDPQGNVLYIEEGYSIVELRRVYMGDGYSATETEYFVYNTDDNLVFNTTIRDTYFTD